MKDCPTCNLDSPPALLSLSQLAKLAGVDTRRVARLLERFQVPLSGGGRKGSTREVLLSDLVTRAPSFWEALRQRQGWVKAQPVAAPAPGLELLEDGLEAP